MRTYSISRRLSHADVDFLGELKVSALLGLLEQAAVEASTEAGYDAARYTRESRVWIIRRTRLQRWIPVGGVDEIEVRTSVADIRRARSLRKYEIRRDKELVAEATTDWVYCDLLSGKPTRIPAELEEALFGDNAPTAPREEALAAAIPGEWSELRRVVHPSDLDHVRHVNNAVYANFLEDGAFGLFAARGWPLSRMLAAGGALRVSYLDAEYLKDAVERDELLVRSWLIHAADLDGEHPTGAHVHQVISRPEGDVLRADTHWKWRRTPAVLGGVPE